MTDNPENSEVQKAIDRVCDFLDANTPQAERVDNYSWYIVTWSSNQNYGVRVAELDYSDYGGSGYTLFQTDPNCVAPIFAVERLIIAYIIEAVEDTEQAKNNWGEFYVEDAESLVRATLSM